MRILTVRQPWAHAIIRLGKDVENRPRNIAGDYRGPVAIHAGLKPFSARGEASQRIAEITGYRPLMMLPSQYGAIIGVVDLVDVHQGPNTEQDPFRAVRSCFQPGKPYGLCSPWAERDAWHLLLTNPRPLRDPIPYRGALGLRKLDADMVFRIEAAIA